MLTDIEISNQADIKKISEIAAGLGLNEDDLELYGRYKAKLARHTIQKLNADFKKKPHGRLILVTAMTPTAAGIGKSTVSIGLADALHKLGKKATLSLREPSLGPCFGIKGGAAGGGYSQIIPMDEINLNFTGDIHAVTAANNLLCSMIDNHLHFGNALRFGKIYFKRCMDLNDRPLRSIKIATGGKVNGQTRNDSFNITAASEIMAILCLAEDLADLKKRLNRIVVGESIDGEPIFAENLKAGGAMAAVLKDAVLPNLVQTLEHTPAFVHGGPFANIAHGTSSVAAAKAALALSDYVITEAGFGADLGAEKFFNIFARQSGLFPDAVVLVATVRALKLHGGADKNTLVEENIRALKGGFANLKAHIENIRKFGHEPVIALNRYATDTESEIQIVSDLCAEFGCRAVVTEGWLKGGNGCLNLAEAVLNTLKTAKQPRTVLYPDDKILINKIITVAQEIYGAGKVTISPPARRDLARFTNWGYGNFPICIAKTQNSLSHEKTMLGAPKNFTFPIHEVRLNAGAGFIVALTGNINTMPGLPRDPIAEQVDVDENGIISGLF